MVRYVAKDRCESDTVASAAEGIAVVLVVHNGARFLESQTRSILDQQTLPDVIYLVDDCSNDRSVAIVQDRLLAMRRCASRL
jgi:GT2 family glycosyltransferase